MSVKLLGESGTGRDENRSCQWHNESQICQCSKIPAAARVTAKNFANFKFLFFSAFWLKLTANWNHGKHSREHELSLM